MFQVHSSMMYGHEALVQWGREHSVQKEMEQRLRSVQNSEGRVSDEEDCCSCPETAYRHPAEGGFLVQERTKLVSSRPKKDGRFRSL